jgi:hypothetical protein
MISYPRKVWGKMSESKQPRLVRARIRKSLPERTSDVSNFNPPSCEAIYTAAKSDVLNENRRSNELAKLGMG